jgi:hypothetical protein
MAVENFVDYCGNVALWLQKAIETLFSSRTSIRVISGVFL